MDICRLLQASSQSVPSWSLVKMKTNMVHLSPNEGSPLKHTDSDISPQEVRAIRESLGLSRAEAGEILGGGPRAFSKYEAGAVKPSTSMVRLLRLLHKDPRALKALGGRKPPNVFGSRPTPFEASGSHISELTDRTLPALLRRLLNSEAQANGIPPSRVHVSSAVTTADGGEDGRIRWTEGPPHTAYLPARFCQFQLKTGRVSPSRVAKEVLTSTGAVKQMVRKAIEENGVYIILCGRSYTQKEIDQRIKSILRTLRTSGMHVSDGQVELRDADQIADWVNAFPAVASWVLQQVQPGLLGPFRSWEHWSGRREHLATPYVEDQRLDSLKKYLRETFDHPRRVAHVVGPSGIGKSRLALEALGAAEDHTSVVRDLVLYAAESESEPGHIRRAVQNLSDSGKRTLIVVDDCTPETRRHIASIVEHESSQVSLITIEDQIPDDPILVSAHRIAGAPASVIEGIVRSVSLGLSRFDRERVVRFADGFPKIAFLVCEARNADIPVAHWTEWSLVERFVLGGQSNRENVLLQVAKLLAVYWAVRYSDSESDWGYKIAELDEGISGDTFHATVKELLRRGVAKQEGSNIIIRPKPIAARLAERQWEEWHRSRWDKVLADPLTLNSKVMAAQQLTQLYSTEIASKVVKYVCRPNGPLASWKQISQPGNAQVLFHLAAICPDVVADLIGNALDGVDLEMVRDDTRRYIVWALEKIAFEEGTFVAGARLLFRLAVHENEAWANNATGQFSALFPVSLGSTEANARDRLAMLDEVLNSTESVQLHVVVSALAKAIQTNHFQRSVGPEVRGAERPLDSWRRSTHDEAEAYVDGCAKRLTELACRNDSVGKAARTGLSEELRSLVEFGLISTVEHIVHEVSASHIDHWAEATESLCHFIAYDAVKLGDEDITRRVQALIKHIKPKSVEARLKFLIKEMPWDYPSDENLESDELDRRQLMEVKNLAKGMMRDSDELKKNFPLLCKGEQRKTKLFGQTIANIAKDPLDLLWSILTTISEIAERDRNYSLLDGVLQGIKNQPNHTIEVVSTLKQRIVQSTTLAPTLPMIISRLGIQDSDVSLVKSALDSNRLSPRTLYPWLEGTTLTDLSKDSVADLFDFLLDRDNESYVVAVDMLSLFTHQERDLLNLYRRQVLKIAASIEKFPLPIRSLTSYGFMNVMKWLLSKGRKDEDACELALLLSSRLQFPDHPSTEALVEPILPILLKDFPEVSWPVIGQEILSNAKNCWHLEFLLGTPNLGIKKEPVIINLPESVMISWCRSNSEKASAFLATVLPILSSGESTSTSHLHPIMRRLIDEFGDRDCVLDGFVHNMLTFSYVGSQSTYFGQYRPIFDELQDHHILAVRLWAQRGARQLNRWIIEADNEDAEYESESPP